MAKQEYKVTRSWKSLTKEEQIQKVREAMAAGHTNVSAAKELGTTPGTVAGIRWKNDIPALFKKSAAKETAPASPPPKNERTVPMPLTPQEQETPRPRGAKPQVAASENRQCTYEVIPGKNCAFKREPGTDRCILHPRR